MLFPKRKEKDGTPMAPKPEELTAIISDTDKMEKYRLRLSDISWLMRQIAENVAIRSNKEDQVTGRFWQGRFKSQKILDEQSLIACSVYVDLNPIRAAMADSIVGSDYTSAQERALSVDAKPSQRKDAWLAPIRLKESSANPSRLRSRRGLRASDEGFLKMSQRDYLQLLDWSARKNVPGKKHITEKCPSILIQLGIEPTLWRKVIKNFGKLFFKATGTVESITAEAVRTGESKYRSPDKGSESGPKLLSAMIETMEDPVKTKS